MTPTTLVTELAPQSTVQEAGRQGQGPGELVNGFIRAGGAGILVIDASALSWVEAARGARAYALAWAALTDAVRRAVAPGLQPEDIVTTTEGDDEVVVVLFRAPGDREFFLRRLPALAAGVTEAVAREAARVVGSAGAEPLTFPVGTAVALHRPASNDDRQFHAALDTARADARLEGAVIARERRRAFERLLFRGDVVCVYQPIVELDTGATHGFESLVRAPAGSQWSAPAALFEAAEKCGLLFEFDCLCRAAGLRQARGGIPKGTRLFLNCLPSAIHDPAFGAARLRETLEAVELTPRDLVFEISESEWIKDFPTFLAVRDEYRALGIRFALDDTGAGYSSMRAVMEIAPDYIKVDAGIVRGCASDAGRRALLHAIQSIAATIDATVIAEGIETEDDLEEVRSAGIALGQGYFLGRPDRLP